MIIPTYNVNFRLILTFQSHISFLRRNFFSNSRSWNLINSNLAKGFSIKALTYWYNNSLTLRADELIFYKFENSSNILGPFISDEINNNLNILSAWIIFDCYLLIEDKFIWWGRCYLSGYSVSWMFQINFARKFNF